MFKKEKIMAVKKKLFDALQDRIHPADRFTGDIKRVAVISTL